MVKKKQNVSHWIISGRNSTQTLQILRQNENAHIFLC